MTTSDISIHQVKSISTGEIQQVVGLDGNPFYVRYISIKNERDEEIKITVYAGTISPLEVQS